MAEENSSAIRQFPCACFYSVCGSFRPTSKLTANSACCPKLSRTMNCISTTDHSDRLRPYRSTHETRGLPATYPHRPSLRLCPSSGCTRCNTPHRGNPLPLSVSDGSQRFPLLLSLRVNTTRSKLKRISLLHVYFVITGPKYQRGQ